MHRRESLTVDYLTMLHCCRKQTDNMHLWLIKTFWRNQLLQAFVAYDECEAIDCHKLTLTVYLQNAVDGLTRDYQTTQCCRW